MCEIGSSGLSIHQVIITW